MTSAGRIAVYAIYVSIFAMGAPFKGLAKSGKETSGLTAVANNLPAENSTFSWSPERKLNWDDFKGPTQLQDEHSAAATHCGISIRYRLSNDKKRTLEVTNTFYTTKSWVKPDGKIPSVLVHEQGHFDLCEVYTRKLRTELAAVNIDDAGARVAVSEIYGRIMSEYENSQQAYESETVHGTNLDIQQKWTSQLSTSLQ